MARPIRIGLLTSSLKEPFVDRAVSGLVEILGDEGAELQALEMHGLSALEYHRFIEEVAARKDLDGLIVCHLRLNIAQVLRFKQEGLPILGLTERIEGLDWATVDEMKAAYVATKHLLDRGHRRIAMVNGPLVSLQARLREDGFLRALADAGLKPGRDQGLSLLNFAEDEGREAGHLIVDLPWSPTAVFVAAGDLAAKGLMDALTVRNKKVPEDVAVVGFDNLPLSEAMGLSTVDQPLETMGRWAARRMLNAIKAKAEHKAWEPCGEMFEPELLIRKSTGAPVGSVSNNLSKTGG